MKHNATRNAVNINKEFNNDLPEVECSSKQIKQVLMNIIIKNGIEAFIQQNQVVQVLA